VRNKRVVVRSGKRDTMIGRRRNEKDDPFDPADAVDGIV
jgi:hypothetical protein